MFETVLILVALIVVGVMLFLQPREWKQPIRSFITSFLDRSDKANIAPPQQRRVDPERFNCRVQKSEANNKDFFIVEIFGLISAPSEKSQISAVITIDDHTIENPEKPQVVHHPVVQRKGWEENPESFEQVIKIGKMPQKQTKLSKWLPIGEIDASQIIFARKGLRKLRFSVELYSDNKKAFLTDASCECEYENDEFGYVDYQDNIERTKMLGVTLAFSISAVDDKMPKEEIEIIKNWAREKIGGENISDQDRKHLERALNKTVQFFQEGAILDVSAIGHELACIASLAARHDIFDLCLQVAGASGKVTVDESHLLKKLLVLLRLDEDYCRGLIQKRLPIAMHDVGDEELILGISEGMDAEAAKQKLNEEYRKWNARVTSGDREVQTQADMMMKFIAEARNKCIQ